MWTSSREGVDEAGPNGDRPVVESNTAIGWVFFLMVVPVCVCWILLQTGGLPQTWYPVLLAVSLVTAVACFDIANQSLSAVMDAPNAISAIHASLLAVSAGAWTLVAEGRTLRSVSTALLFKWMMVAALFSGYQLINHMVSYLCSLSERIVFMNLCPVLSLLLETLLFPEDRKPKVNQRCKVALVMMALGAVLYSTQKNNVTLPGMMAASLLVLTVIPYRLVQRYAISGPCASLPVGLLASLDGCFLLVPSAAVSEATIDDNLAALRGWFSTSTVVLLMVLSGCSFVANHILGLLLMKVSTATSYIVFSNIANFMIISVSFAVFHEAMDSRLMFCGLAVSLVSGLWYSAEVCSMQLSGPLGADKKLEDVQAAEVKR